MTLANVLAHARFYTYRHGWPGVLGLVLLGIAIAVQTLVVPAVQAQTTALLAAQEALRQRVQKPPDKQDSAAAQQAAFLASLPAGGTNAGSDTVKAIHRIAAAHGVRLATGEYRMVREGSDPFQRYQITLPASASYPHLRAWVAQMMNEIPNLALDELSLRRADVGAENIEARMRFTLFMKAP